MNYPTLHRGRVLAYCWDCTTPVIDNFSLSSRSPYQLGSDKYTKLSDVFYDSEIDNPLLGLGTRRVSFNYTTADPFPGIYSFPGWVHDVTISPTVERYINDAGTVRWFKGPMTFEGRLDVFIHYYTRLIESASNYITPNTRNDRRNTNFFYSINARLKFNIYYYSQSFTIGGFPLHTGSWFFLQGNIGYPDYADSFYPLWGTPFYPQNVFYPSGPNNIAGFEEICPLPTLSKCSQNVCREVNKTLNSSQVQYPQDTINIPSTSGYEPIEITNLIQNTYNSVKNISLDVTWKLASLQYFVPSSLPNESILIANDGSWGTGQNSWLN